MTDLATTHTFDIKQGDTAPDLATVLLDGDLLPVDLTAASTVTLTMRLAAHPRTLVLDAVPVAFAPDTSGAVHYVWAAGDTDVAGVYHIDWTVIWLPATKMTFPSCGFDKVRVNARG